MSAVPAGDAAGHDPVTGNSDPIARNITDIVELERLEAEAAGLTARRFERLSRHIARPRYLLGILAFVILWIVWNTAGSSFGLVSFDPPPFAWLQGLVTLVALITAAVVLVGQDRQTRLTEQRAHLDLQINLLTEQKVSKLLHLVEELQKAVTSNGSGDPQLAQLKKPTDAAEVVSALKDSVRAARDRD